MAQCLEHSSQVKVAQLCPTTLCDPMDCSPWNSPGQNTRVGSPSLLQVISQPRIQTRSPTLQANSLPAESQGSPKHSKHLINNSSPFPFLFISLISLKWTPSPLLYNHRTGLGLKLKRLKLIKYSE